MNEAPDFIKNASELTKNICSLNMVNSYNFSLTRTGFKNRFKYQSIVFENDVDNLITNVLPRVPKECRYLLMKRPNEVKKPEEFRIDIKQVKQILKF